MTEAIDETGLDQQGDHGATVRSVQRAIDIMTLITDGTRAHSIGEIMAATGLAKTTVIRLLYTLEANGLLVSTPRGYLPGPGLWRWAFAVHSGWELPPAARELMRELVRENRETVNLYVRRGQVRVCVAQEESPMPLRHVVRIGDQLPLWSGASAKVLLSGVPEETVRRIYATAESTAPPLDAFLADVAAVAGDGYAQSHGEREAGLSAVAVPVRSQRGAVVAALSFSGPTARFPAERIAGLAAQLSEAAVTFTRLDVDHPLRTT